MPYIPAFVTRYIKKLAILAFKLLIVTKNLAKGSESIFFAYSSHFVITSSPVCFK
jgi:hypothetical protein